MVYLGDDVNLYVGADSRKWRSRAACQTELTARTSGLALMGPSAERWARWATPMPSGRHPSIAALTRSGSRRTNA
jgi:hypothetical protein